MDGWNTTFLLGRLIFRGYVSFREGIFKTSQRDASKFRGHSGQSAHNTYSQNITFPETNSEFTPENGWLEDEFPFGLRLRPFSGVELLVSGGGIHNPNQNICVYIYSYFDY